MKLVILNLIIFALPLPVSAIPMQHGFIFGAENNFLSHLVANGHHSHQSSLTGTLTIVDDQERELFRKKRASSTNTYFVFQAENIELTELSSGQILQGYIFESEIKKYEPGNRIVSQAEFEIEGVYLTVPNPFFTSVRFANDLQRTSLTQIHSCEDVNDEYIRTVKPYERKLKNQADEICQEREQEVSNFKYAINEYNCGSSGRTGIPWLTVNAYFDCKDF